MGQVFIKKAFKAFCILSVVGISGAALYSSTATNVLAAESEFLDPEQAFQMSAKALDAKTIEVRFVIAQGYYMYKDKFGFKASKDGQDAAANPSNAITLGTTAFPASTPKVDPQFGQTDTYRGTLIMPISVASGATVGEPFTVSVKAQGCADAGLCYPPFTRTALVTLTPNATPLAVVTNTVSNTAEKTVVKSVVTAAAPVDESSRISTLLAGKNLPLILASFFGFGLLLSLTPCVFPMIPILSGIIVGSGKQITKKRAFVLSLTYVLGMALTYTAAGIAAGLSGTLLTAALQNAWVLGSFALVFVALSLSMFGFYELQLPNSLQSRLNNSANQQGGSITGIAIMGALSALIVGPCVAAPLAGALLYIAQSGDAVLGGLSLFVMALGMGVPLLLIGTVAGSLLPRAGAWMDGIKKAFGVMLLGVALWLAQPVLPELLVMLGWASLLLFSGVYLRALDSLPVQATGANRFWKGTGLMLTIAGGAMLVGALAGSRDPLQPLASLRGAGVQHSTTGTDVGSAFGSNTTAAMKPLQFERVSTTAQLDARLAKAKGPVMLDFYADWCVSCKEMDHFTFTDKSVRDRLNTMELIQVDVTANSADDKALLKRFSLFGPPGIVFFHAGATIPAKETNRVIGFQKAPEFVKSLDVVLALR